MMYSVTAAVSAFGVLTSMVGSHPQISTRLGYIYTETPSQSSLRSAVISLARKADLKRPLWFQVTIDDNLDRELMLSQRRDKRRLDISGVTKLEEIAQGSSKGLPTGANLSPDIKALSLCLENVKLSSLFSLKVSQDSKKWRFELEIFTPGTDRLWVEVAKKDYKVTISPPSLY